MYLLKGLRVLECGVLINGAHVGNYFGEQGADVIKIDPPPRGDYIRNLMGIITPDHSPTHMQLNKNKRSIMLNLKSDEGKKIFFELLRTTDVFVDGFIQGACNAMGIGYEVQKAHKPDIIYVQYTGYGASGPYAPIPTHGRMMSAAGGKFRVAVSDDGLIRAVEDTEHVDGPFSGSKEAAEATWAGGIMAAWYAAAALARRDRTGEGAYIDVSAADATVVSAWTGNLYGANQHRVTEWVNMPTSPPGSPKLVEETPVEGFDGAKYFFYETKDHGLILFGCIEHKWWNKFCDLVGRPDMRDEREVPPSALDFAIGDRDLYYKLRDIILTRTREEWLALAAGHDLPIGPTNVTVAEMLADPQLRSRNVFVDVQDPVAGDFTYLGSSAVIDGEPYVLHRPAPLAGEQSAEILDELGYDSDRVAKLFEDKVVR